MSNNQQKEDLELQEKEKCLFQCCHQNNIYIPVVYKELGLNMICNRTKFNQLIKQIKFEEFSTHIINCPDRLIHSSMNFNKTKFNKLIKQIELK